MNNAQLKIKGLKHSEEIAQLMAQKVEELRWLAPKGAVIDFSIKRKGQDIKGIIKIFSKKGRLCVVATGNKLQDVQQKLKEQITKRLKKIKDSSRRTRSAVNFS